MKSGGPRSGTEIRGPRSNQPPPNPTPPPISPQSPPHATSPVPTSRSQDKLSTCLYCSRDRGHPRLDTHRPPGAKPPPQAPPQPHPQPCWMGGGGRMGAGDSPHRLRHGGSPASRAGAWSIPRMGGLGEVGVTPRPPRSQPLQGEALAEAEAQVADGENLWEERRHFGVQPRPGGRGASFPLGSLAELRSP